MWEKIHDRVRLWFGLTQTIVKVINGKEFVKEVGSDTIAAIGGGVTYINSDYLAAETAAASGIKPEVLFENADVHEQGHVYREYEAPGTFKCKVVDVKNLKKHGIIGNAAHSLLNIVYDTIIDVRNYDRGIYDGSTIIKTFQAKDPDNFKGSVVGEYLVGFREEAQGQTMAWFPIRESVREASKTIVAFVRQPIFVYQNGMSFISNSEKVAEIGRILAELFKEDEPEDQDPQEGEGGEGSEGEGGESEGSGTAKPGKGKPSKSKSKKGGKSKPGGFTEEDLKAIAEAIQEAIEQGLVGEAKSAEEAEGDINAALAEIDLKDPEEAKIAQALLNLANNEFAFHMVWADAEKSVKFDMQANGMVDGEQIRACDQPWRAGEPISNLDVAATMLRTGMFLPGATTVQGHYMPGPGVPQPAPFFEQIIISADCSGSMEASSPYPNRTSDYNHDLVCAAIFAMIHEARKKRIRVGVNLFGDSNKFLVATQDYEKLARDVWRCVSRVGGGNDVAGTEPIRDVVRAGSLLVYITDFHLFRKCAEAKKDLHNFIAGGADVTFIAMFDNHNGAATGLEYAECKQLKDLQSITLKAARAKFNN